MRVELWLRMSVRLAHELFEGVDKSGWRRARNERLGTRPNGGYRLLLAATLKRATRDANGRVDYIALGSRDGVQTEALRWLSGQAQGAINPRWAFAELDLEFPRQYDLHECATPGCPVLIPKTKTRCGRRCTKLASRLRSRGGKMSSDEAQLRA